MTKEEVWNEEEGVNLEHAQESLHENGNQWHHDVHIHPVNTLHTHTPCCEYCSQYYRYMLTWWFHMKPQL